MQAFVVGQMGGGTLMKGFAIQVLREKGAIVLTLFGARARLVQRCKCVPPSMSGERRGEVSGRQTYM